MIQIDMPMPERCDDCRFCVVEYTDDNKPDSFAYCCVAEKFIAKSCDGTDKAISTAILVKQPWCPLKAQESFGVKYDNYGDTVCGNCGYTLSKKYDRCPACMKEIDWREQDGQV